MSVHINKPTPHTLRIGTETKFGRISAVGMKDGERFYMMIKNGVTSLMPHDVVENPHPKE